MKVNYLRATAAVYSPSLTLPPYTLYGHLGPLSTKNAHLNVIITRADF